MSGATAPAARRRHWDGATVLVVAPSPTHPQDFGNRKRIFRICKLLQEAGAAIHYVHYPAEGDWRGKLPRAAQDEMIAQWDGYYLAPPSRHLHTRPAGDHHEIDEWWDPSLGTMLSWLSAKLSPDVVIVNYTWLSKALEFAPRGALKILDTHDKFSGRKELLAANGLAPEFFYTTPEEETKALDRADVVWAIKEEERQELEQMTVRPVVTVPHVDPFTPVPPRPLPAPPDGELRVGVIGAANNVNFRNLLRFCAVAGPIFRAHLPALKLVIGGTICDHLDQLDLPFVEKLGWVEDVTDFYRGIDIALIPMAFSTGLKIKAAEAMSLGLPILSHAHAFEGYRAFHRFQQMDSFEAMALALVDIACDPGRHLDAMRQASAASLTATCDALSAGLAETGALGQARPGETLVSLHPDATRRGSLYGALLNGQLEYLAHRGQLSVYLGAATDPAGVARFCQRCPVHVIHVDPRLRDRLDADEIRRAEAAGARWTDFDRLLAGGRVSQLWLDHAPESRPPTPADIEQIYVSPAWALPPGGDVAALAARIRPLLGPLTGLNVLESRDTPAGSALRAALDGAAIAVPPFWMGRLPLLGALEPLAPENSWGLNVILPRRDPALIAFLADAARLAGQPMLNIVETDRPDGALEREYRRGCDYRYFSRAALDSPARNLLRRSGLTLNFATRDPFANGLAALLDAAGHAVLTPGSTEPDPARPDSPASLTVLALLERIGAGLSVSAPRPNRAALNASLRNFDPGWTRIWAQAPRERTSALQDRRPGR